MMQTAPSSTARVFLVAGAPASVTDVERHAATLSFTELPRLPIPVRHPASDSPAETRPLVSPILHLGRQSPLLRTALGNDRRWSRKLVEVTTWCIRGLHSSDGVCPVDDASLAFAGVRVRLCGRGGPVRLLPRVSSPKRCVQTLTEEGACVWLQHGDVLDFGGGVLVSLLAVHVRTGVASELAQKASYMWVRAANAAMNTMAAAGATTSNSSFTVPVSMWSLRFAHWATVPKFLKAKMLAEAASLVRHAALEEEEVTRMRSSATTAVPSVRSRGSCSQHHEDERGTAKAGSDGLAVQQGEGEACALVGVDDEDLDVDAATPTSQPLHRHAHTDQNSPSSLFHDRRLTRSAPELQTRRTTAASDPQMTTMMPRPSSQGRSPPSAHRVFGTTTSLRGSVGGQAARYSMATFSETMDDKLHEALLNLENGGSAVSEALARQREPAMLLGAMEDDDLRTPRHSLPTAAGGSPSARELTETEEKDGMGRRRRRDSEASANERASDGVGRRSSKRGRGAVGGRHSGVRQGEDQGGRGSTCVSSSRRGRHNSATSASPSQPMKVEEADGFAAAPPLTRADMRRLRNGPPVQEDSQVVFFDH